MRTKVLMDHSIVTRSSLMRWVEKPLEGFHSSARLWGAERIPPFSDPAWEAEAEAILTVGKLVREKKVEAFSSMELKWEAMRDYLGSTPLDAFEGCDIDIAPNPIERGRFVRAELGHYVKKGGKKDIAEGKNGASQISFFRWLLKLEPDSMHKILEARESRQLTDFDCESLNDLGWFKALATRLKSEENLPDAFHLWTARRNRIDVFLTLDRKLINHAASIESEKSGFRLGVRVRSPIAFLREEGVANPEPYPFRLGQFYTFVEIKNIAAK
ncbi:MAG: hypothetical protein HC845_02365 [Akkermansiaceae bacterium]|nr:hypothetical protein [Akkermansiaceae bacterium]